MSYIHPLAAAHLRRRWTRHDAWRFAPPGSPEAKMPPVGGAPAAPARGADDADAAWQAEIAALRASHERLRCAVAELKSELAWRRFVRKYSPDQPRVPAGNSDGGQWKAGPGSGGSSTDRIGEADFRNDRLPILAGGFTDDQLNFTVQTFVSAYCLGSINRVLPGQFMGVTIADVMAEAQRGNSAVRMCLKLLMQDRFRK